MPLLLLFFLFALRYYIINPVLKPDLHPLLFRAASEVAGAPQGSPPGPIRGITLKYGRIRFFLNACVIHQKLTCSNPPPNGGF